MEQVRKDKITVRMGEKCLYYHRTNDGEKPYYNLSDTARRRDGGMYFFQNIIATEPLYSRVIIRPDKNTTNTEDFQRSVIGWRKRY